MAVEKLMVTLTLAVLVYILFERSKMSALDELLKYSEVTDNIPEDMIGYSKQELTELRARLADCEDNLKSMVEQYCRGHNFSQNDPSKYEYAHEFMSAGECTFEYLVKHGLAEWAENGVDIRLKPLQEKP